jgi:single-strand DNA-binding protein
MADQLKISGILHVIQDEQQVSEKLKKQVIVIKTDGQYPEYIPVEFVNDKIDLLANLRTGEQTTVYFNLRGREWQSKYFLNASGWKVEQAGAAAPVRPAAPKPTAQPIASDDDNDLPF